MGSTLPVVVGADGSPESLDAVAWAAREARARNRPLRIVHAYMWPPVATPFPVAPYDPGIEQVAAQIVDQARSVAGDGVEVETTIVMQQPAAALIAAVEDASLAVVGHRGRGGVTGLLLGSVGVALAAHTTSPAVIVRGTGEQGRVVVGVDGSHEGERALEFAFDEAERAGAGLTALHAYGEAEEHHGLAEIVARWTEKYPDVDAHYHGMNGKPAEVLAGATHDARLLVVGSRGRGGFKGLLLGSVSQAAIRSAACPVAVVK